MNIDTFILLKTEENKKSIYKIISKLITGDKKYLALIHEVSKISKNFKLTKETTGIILWISLIQMVNKEI